MGRYRRGHSCTRQRNDASFFRRGWRYCRRQQRCSRLVIFSTPHSVHSRSAFSSVDLCPCRIWLSYFGPDVQNSHSDLHYSRRPGGYLCSGAVGKRQPVWLTLSRCESNIATFLRSRAVTLARFSFGWRSLSATTLSHRSATVTRSTHVPRAACVRPCELNARLWSVAAPVFAPRGAHRLILSKTGK